MSGAEFIAIIGILASIEQLVEASARLVKRAVQFSRDNKELPKTLQELRTFLPFLAMAVRKRADRSVLERLNEPDRQVLMIIFRDLKFKVQELEVLLNDYLPGEDASSGRKLLKAVGSFGVEKKIDKIVKVIFERYMPILTLASIDNPNIPTNVISAAMEGTSLETGLNLKPHFLVKIQRDDDFIGRETIMDRLRVLLSGLEKHNRVALVGLGGMGKTRIALEFALQYKKSRDMSVFWVHASSARRVTEAYDEIAQQAKILVEVEVEEKADGRQALKADKMRGVKYWLENEASGRWLMIIDNADDHDLLYGASQLATYFPRCDHGSIIMTTRDKAIGLKFVGAAAKIIPVQALNPGSCQNLLEAKLNIDANDGDDCRLLSEELEGVPLALVQAAAYINEQSITVQDYLEMYRSSESSKIHLLSEDFEDMVRKGQDTKSPVAATWEISFENIRTRNPLAAQLLSRMCIMDSQGIPVSLLECETKREDFTKALGTLQAFCMITLRDANSDKNTRKEKYFDLYRLVRLSMRNWLKMHSELDTWMALALKTLTEKYPNLEATGWQQQVLWKAYLPHALVLLSSDQLVIDSTSSVANVFKSQFTTGKHAPDGTVCGCCAAGLMLQVSWTFAFLDSKPENTLWAERALSLRERIMGAQDSGTIDCMIQYAMALYRQNRIEEARTVGIRAVELISITKQPMSLQVQAAVRTIDEQFIEAENLYSKRIEMCKAHYGPEHPETIASVEGLASNFQAQKRFDECEELMVQVMEDRTRLFGPEYPDTLLVTTSLSALYYELERYEDAERLNARVSDLRAKVFGPKHPGTMIAMSNLAASFYGQGRYEEGIKLGLRVWNLQKEVIGPEDSSTLSTLSNLASAYERHGQLDVAQKLRSEALEGRTKTLGPRHPVTIGTMTDLAGLFEKRRNFEAAERLRLQLIEIHIALFGVKHVKTFQSMYNLIGNYNSQSCYDKLEKAELDVLYVLIAAYGTQHADTIYRMASHAASWAKMERNSEAVDQARSAYKLAVNCLNLNHPTREYCGMTLGSVLANSAYLSEAQKVYREALIAFEKNEGEDVTQKEWMKSSLAVVLILAGEFVEARSLAESASKTLLLTAGAEDSRTTYSNQVLALLYSCTGQYSKAERAQLIVLKTACLNWTVEDTLEEHHAPILSALHNLGDIYSREQRYKKAEELAILSYKAYEKLHGPRSDKTLTAMKHAGWNLSFLGRKREALAICLRAKEGLDTFYPKHENDLIYSDISVARLYLLNDQLAEADHLALQVLRRKSEIISSKSIVRICLEEVLGATLSAQGRLKEAEAAQEATLVLSKEVLSPEHPLTVDIMRGLARTVGKLGRLDQQKDLETQADELTKLADLGLGEGEWKESQELVEKICTWLENETKDVADITALGSEVSVR